MIPGASADGTPGEGVSVARGRVEPLGPRTENMGDGWEIRPFSGVGSIEGWWDPRPSLRTGSLPLLRPILALRVSNAAPPPNDLSGNCTSGARPGILGTNNYLGGPQRWLDRKRNIRSFYPS